MNRFGWLAVSLGLAGLALTGCGDDDGGDTMTGADMGPVVSCADDPCAATERCFDREEGGVITGHRCVACPTDAPNPDEQMPPCCWRVSNADRQEMPEFRVTNLQIDEPTGSALTSGAVLNLLAQSAERETFNWLMQVTVSGTDVTVLTGYGQYNESAGTYSFVDGIAPTDGGGDPDRWNPIMIEGTLSGDTFSADPVPGAFSVPIFDEAGVNLDTELPLTSFEVVSATLSEERSCIGERINDRAAFNNYETGGQVVTFVTVEDAIATPVMQLGTTICNLISGSDCEADATGDWRFPPDGLCTDGTCAACDFSATGDCNAWRIVGGFAAAGVEIE